MKSFLFIFIGAMFCGQGGVAAEPKIDLEPWHVEVLPLGLEFRFEREESQQMADRRPLNLALGGRKGSSSLLFEYSSFTETTGNVTLSLERTHQEYSFWWKEKFMDFEFMEAFFSAGLGGYEEKLTTSLAMSGSTTDTSALQALGGAGAGLQTLVFKYVLLSIEGRFIAGKNFDPNPQASFLLRLGGEF
ncbi:MAG: hypothetical protein ACXVB1_10995 [Pseudobdellovibrionaceae bacterium]